MNKHDFNLYLLSVLKESPLLEDTNTDKQNKKIDNLYIFLTLARTKSQHKLN